MASGLGAQADAPQQMRPNQAGNAPPSSADDGNWPGPRGTSGPAIPGSLVSCRTSIYSH
jgi:hypothetical protein